MIDISDQELRQLGLKMGARMSVLKAAKELPRSHARAAAAHAHTPKPIGSPPQAAARAGNSLASSQPTRAPPLDRPFHAMDAQQVVASMRAATSTPIVQQHGCQRLKELASSDEFQRQTIASCGGIEAVLDAMLRHLHEATVQEAGCPPATATAANIISPKSELAPALLACNAAHGLQCCP